MSADHLSTSGEQPVADDDRQRCAGCSCCSAEAPGPTEGTIRGPRLVLVSMGLFLGPIVLAIAGAALSPAGESAQLLGALGGLAVGMVASIAIGRFVQTKNDV